MLVYDITNEKSFDNIKNWIRNIEEVSEAPSRDPQWCHRLVTGHHQPVDKNSHWAYLLSDWFFFFPSTLTKRSGGHGLLWSDPWDNKVVSVIKKEFEYTALTLLHTAAGDLNTQFCRLLFRLFFRKFLKQIDLILQYLFINMPLLWVTAVHMLSKGGKWDVKLQSAMWLTVIHKKNTLNSCSSYI